MERQTGRCSKAGQLTLDFANVFKAFIGTNYLSAAFNFKQSGLLLGAIGIVLIASATVHCCHLIVKCKKRAIHKILAFEGDLLDSTIEAAENPSRLRLRKRVERCLSYGDIAWIAAGKWGLALVNFGLCVTQTGFCIGYFIFLGNTVSNLFPLVEGTISFPAATISPNVSMVTDIATTVPTTNFVTTMATTINSTEVDYFYTYMDSTSVPDVVTVNASKIAINASSFNPAFQRSGPSSMYYILVAALVPVFVMFALLRNIRHMGPASLVANISVVIGYFAVMGFILSDFTVSNTVELVQWTTFPIFFGGVTAGYEGIGTIIPIESSMEENRRIYPHLLYSAMLLFTFILASMGILGYLHFGDSIEQVIIWNLPPTSALPIVVNSVICVGVLFTFPLQNFPVIEIFEELIFAQGKICGPPKVTEIDAEDEFPHSVQSETSPLLKENELEEIDKDMAMILKKLPVATVIPDSVPAWKRNILRILIVLFQAGVAIVFKDDFAYFGAFIGAIGSTTLGYIVPCFIHISLGGRRLGWPIITKDVVIIIFGITGGVASVYASVVAMIK